MREYLARVYDKYFNRDYEESSRIQKEKRVKIDDVIKALQEHKAEQEVDTADTQQKILLLEKYRDTEPPFNDGQSKEILSLICYGNTGYCCGLTKTCPWRDAVLNLFNVSSEEYEKAKNELHNKLTDGKIIYDKKQDGNS